MASGDQSQNRDYGIVYVNEDRPLLGTASVNADVDEDNGADQIAVSAGFQWALMAFMVVLPVMLTGSGYLVTNEGGGEPDEHQPGENLLEWFLVMVGQFVHENVDIFTAISVLTNLIFTAYPAYKVHQATLKRENYVADNLAIAGVSTALGGASGLNYVPLMAACNPRFFDSFRISNAAARSTFNYLGYGFTGTMMYLNTISLHEIITKLQKFWQAVKAKQSDLGSSQIAAFKEVLAENFPNKRDKIGVILAIGLGALYGYQVNKDISEYLAVYMPKLAADLLGHTVFGAGNYTFGMVFGNSGFKSLLSGVYNLFSSEHSCPQRLNQFVMGALALTWACFTVIPSMSQASPGDVLGLITMTTAALFFNLPASRGMINLLRSALIFDLEGVKKSFLGTSDEKEAFAIEVGSTPFARLCCASDRSGYERLTAKGDGRPPATHRGHGAAVFHVAITDSDAESVASSALDASSLSEHGYQGSGFDAQ